MYEVFLGGYGTLKNDCDFYVHQVSCKCVKKHSIAVLRNIPFSNCLKKTPHVSFFAIYMGVFAIQFCFQFAISICAI